MQQQVVVVTGASSGVGRAVARAFGRKGAKVAILARNTEALNACAAEIQGSGGEALVLAVDVSCASAVDDAAAAVQAQWGHIDVWVNTAMVTVFAPVKDTSAEEYRRVTEVTYLGYVHGTLSALRRMLPRNTGTIVQVGSALAYRSIPLQSAYCAAKAAIRGFTDALRCELIHDGSKVRLTHVHLPAVNTPQSDRQRNKMPNRPQPVPPMFTPEAAAAAIVHAAAHAPREMLVGLPTTMAVWGQKVIPGLLDWHLGRRGWDAQLTDEANVQSDDILFHSLPGDPGAHGPFRSRERGPDLQMRLQVKPAAVVLATLGLALAAAQLLRAKPIPV